MLDLQARYEHWVHTHWEPQTQIAYRGLNSHDTAEELQGEHWMGLKTNNIVKTSLMPTLVSH